MTTPIMTAEERSTLLRFISEYASDDQLITISNRIASNLDDKKTLLEWAKRVPYSATYAGELGTVKVAVAPQPPWAESADKAAKETSDALRANREVTPKEDLGPPCSKLGRNGQDILKFIETDGPVTIQNIRHALKLSESKIKPMLGLMLERGMIVWHDNNSWRVK